MSRAARWLDHLPPWLSFGALATTGAFDRGEMAAMAAPLLAAALVEALRLDLSRWRRLIEFSVLAFLILEASRRPGLIPLVVHTLCFLCGARLVLPREMAQRRQLLLMGFLLLLVTSISTVELAFLGWALAWLMAAAALLLQQAWEQSAAVRRGPLTPPPYARVVRWAPVALALAAAFFLVLPRVTLGFRPLPLRGVGGGSATSGFSDHLDLGGDGPIQGNSEVVARIQPMEGLERPDRVALESRLALLRGLGLDAYDGRKWEARGSAGPQRFLALVPAPLDLPQDPDLVRLFLASNPTGIIPLPYGELQVLAPASLPLRNEAGRGPLRWALPSGARPPLALRLLGDQPLLRAGEPQGAWRAQLTETAGLAVRARAWSQQLAPPEPQPARLAQTLTAQLQARFRYDLGNPSGKAEHPLVDFMERTRAGHCEYFASALTLMLRARDIPARVVNGYRLGPWIPEGGYWLVTQNEAHSWVEYWDDHRWRVADPTPAAPPSALSTPTWSARWRRMVDAARFHWDRHVVRFSDQDQQAGLSWAQAKVAGVRMPSLRKVDWTEALPRVAMVLFLLLAAWRFRGPLRALLPRSPGVQGIRALRPLLRRVGDPLAPGSGETARAWLQRLAQARPDHRAQLEDLAAQVDAVAYGGAPEGDLRKAVRDAARAWPT